MATWSKVSQDGGASGRAWGNVRGNQAGGVQESVGGWEVGDICRHDWGDGGAGGIHRSNGRRQLEQLVGWENKVWCWMVHGAGGKGSGA